MLFRTVFCLSGKNERRRRLTFKGCYRIYFGLLVCIVLWPMQHSYSQPFAEGKSKWLGNVYGNSAPQAHWDTYWNQVTPENAGKWLYCEGTRDVMTIGGVAAAYDFAKDREIPFRFHTLVWGQQYPTWIDALPDSEQVKEVEEWIQHIGENFPEIDFVDVVNEPLAGHAPATYRNALGGAGTTGWDWVIWVFQKARQYMPTAKLFINEYNIVNNDGSTNTYKNLIDTLKVRNLIDGIGIQCHRFEIENASLTQMKNNLDKLASTGLPIHLTEFDLGNRNDQGPANDSVQLYLYKQRFPLFWEHPAVTGITLWGYVAGQMWQTTAYLRTGTGVERPALQWLRKYVTAPFKPILVSPATSTTGVPRNPKLVWRSSETAASYGLQIATDSAFTSLVLELTDLPDTSLTSIPLDANTKFFWRVNAVNSRDTSGYSVIASFTTGDQLSAVKGRERVPSEVQLAQNYPNPFNPVTTIRFSLPVKSDVRLSLVNTLGQVMKEIANGSYGAGEHHVTLNASPFPSGVYFYRMETNTGFAQTKKLVLMK